MKSLRIWFLLLLAVLLPLRGAVAAAMLCAPAGIGTQTEAGVMGHSMGHSMDQHHDASAATASQGHGHHGHGDHGHGEHGAWAHAETAGAQDAGSSGGMPDKCDVCSAFCSLTPLVSSAPTVPAPLPLASTAFPALSAPVPTFLSDGQDRPPRSI